MKDQLEKLASVYRALGDQKRLRIIKMLASNMSEVFCVSDLAQQLDISQPAVSQHLRILKSIGILDENRRGFRVYYTINAEVMNTYQKEIDDMFKKAYEKCTYDYSCDQCPYNKQT